MFDRRRLNLMQSKKRKCNSFITGQYWKKCSLEVDHWTLKDEEMESRKTKKMRKGNLRLSSLRFEVVGGGVEKITFFTGIFENKIFSGAREGSRAPRYTNKNQFILRNSEFFDGEK